MKTAAKIKAMATTGADTCSMARMVASRGASPVVDIALHRFHHHDRVVHHDADREHQAEHAGDVDGEAEQREERERSHHRHRHRQQRNQRRSPVLQEDEHHQNYQADRGEQREHDIRNRGAHEPRGIVGDLVSDVRREVLLGAAP